MTSASLCRKAAYLDSVDLDQARSHRVAEPIAVVVLVSVIWWCAYGRTTPFPSIWRVIPKDDQVGWLFAASALVAVALVAIVAIVDKLIKQRKDSIAAFEGAGRQDLADKEKAEMAVLQAYLPARMSEAEVIAAVQAIVAEVGAKGPGDMGKVMGVVKTRLAGKADMGQVSAAVKAALAG